MSTTTKSSLLEQIEAIRARRVARGHEEGLPQSGWKTVAGTVEDNAHFREAARLGEVWRQQQNDRR
jgi:hypothetical protein